MLRIKPIFRNVAPALALAGASLIANPAHAPAPVLTPEQKYANLIRSLPANVAEFSRVRPKLPFEIRAAYDSLKEQCPQLSNVDMRDSWNLSNWLNRNITKDEWKNSPYKFRLQAFRAAAVQGNTGVKIELLTKLSSVLPFDPQFIAWMDVGRQRFNSAIRSDEFLIAEKKNWKKVVKDQPRLQEYIVHVQKVFFESFLQRRDIALPSIEIASNPDANWRGGYVSDRNHMKLNFVKGGPNRKNPHELDAVIAHESFHAVQKIIEAWRQQKSHAHDIAFEDAGEKFFYGSDNRLAMILNTENYEGYRQSFKEGSAFYVGQSASSTGSMDMDSLNPVKINEVKKLRSDGPHVRMPAACQIR